MARPGNHLHNTWHLGIKEFRSLLGDPTMLFLIVFMFSVAVYSDAHSKPESLYRAAIAVVDEDRFNSVWAKTRALAGGYEMRP